MQTNMLLPGAFGFSRRRQAGLSILEVLVGVVISIVVSIAIFQALIGWSQRTRSTSSGGEAQVAGTLSIYRLERDLQHAGMGFMGFGTVTNVGSGCQVATPDSGFTFFLAPVRIIPPASGEARDPDSLQILYGVSSYMTSGTTISTTQAESKQLGASRAGFNLGDRFVAVGRDTGGTVRCRLLEVTGYPTAGDDGRTIVHQSNAVYNNYYKPGTNRTSSSPNSTIDWTGGLAEGWAYNLGPDPQLAVWTVGGGGVGNTFLRRSNELFFTTGGVRQPTDDLEVAAGVVNLKAQYGVDNDSNGRIASDEWTTTAPTDWRRLLAVRVAVLVRSQNFEPPVEVNSNRYCLYSDGNPDRLPQPRWFGTPFEIANIGGAAGSPLNGSDWRCYRYSVYERVISLRNVIWGVTSPSPL